MKRLFSIFMVFVLILFINSNVTLAQVQFSDTKSTDWFFGSLSTVSSEGIITGFPDLTFRPSGTLTFEQFIVMMCRMTGNDVGVSSVGAWSQNYLNYAKEAGWLDGFYISDYSQPINRYYTAAITIRAMDLSESEYPDQWQDYDIYIEDFETMPSKFQDAVLLNYALGITTGYPDNTFRGLNNLTRAEAAVITHRVIDDTQRKAKLPPEKTEDLMALFAMALPPMLPLEGEVLMDGPVMTFVVPGMDTPVPMTSLPLDPSIAEEAENILADTLLELGDLESDNQVAAGFGYGFFNINLLSQENESILIYTVSTGSKVVTIDLLLMTDAEGNLRPDARDIITLICKNINYDQWEGMVDFILTNYENRLLIPEEGNDITLDSTHMGISSLIHDHNVLKVTISDDSLTE